MDADTRMVRRGAAIEEAAARARDKPVAAAPLPVPEKCPSRVHGHKKTSLPHKRTVIEARIAELQAELAAETGEIGAAIALREATAAALTTHRGSLARKRTAAGVRPGRANGGT